MSLCINPVDKASYPRINTLRFWASLRINTLPFCLFLRINTLRNGWKAAPALALRGAPIWFSYMYYLYVAAPICGQGFALPHRPVAAHHQ